MIGKSGNWTTGQEVFFIQVISYFGIVGGVMDQMRAVVCEGAGGADVLRVATVERPAPWPNLAQQVLIRIHAAGINRPDVLQRSGLYAPPKDASPLLGLEVAGEVVEVKGDGDWKVGDQVCALTHGGGYAEYVWADARQCLPVPRDWTMAQAASLPETLFTVWLNVFERAQLGLYRPSETLLIHAGASGIGASAIQLAKALGHRVVVTLRQMNKADFCRDLGADEVVLLDEQWAETVLEKTGGRGVDVILDMLGTATAAGDMKVLAKRGRIAWIAFLTGSRMELKVHEIMGKEAVLTGAFLRPQTADTKAQLAQGLREQVWPKIEQGLIVPMVDRVFSFEQVREAHEYMESNQHSGKLVLSWAGE